MLPTVNYIELRCLRAQISQPMNDAAEKHPNFTGDIFLVAVLLASMASRVSDRVSEIFT